MEPLNISYIIQKWRGVSRFHIYTQGLILRVSLNLSLPETKYLLSIEHSEQRTQKCSFITVCNLGLLVLIQQNDCWLGSCIFFSFL